MLFSGKENVFMCLVAFQKMFRKIFSDVWLCSWKYHRKYIFTFSTCCSHFLTFSWLPNDYIISFIHQNTNKTQQKIIKSGQTKARLRSERSRSAWSWSERSAHRDRQHDAFARCVDRIRAMRQSRSREDRRIARRSKQRSRSRSPSALPREPVMSADGDVAISLSLSLSLSLLFSKVGSTLKWK